MSDASNQNEFEKGPLQGQPPNNPKINIWKYMDFAKLVSILENSGLYFPRADELGDPFEGSTPKGMYRPEAVLKRHRQLHKSFFKTTFPTREKLAIAAQIRQVTEIEQRKHYQKNAQQVLISCWHMNEHESAGMWKLYGQIDTAVAVRSTYERLRQVLPKYVDIGEIAYIDYDNDTLPSDHLMERFWHKRKSFEHERELRAILWAPNAQSEDQDLKISEGEGVWLPVNLNDLIEVIYVSPTTPTWFGDLVADVVKRYQLTAAVKQSNINATPIF